MDSQQIDQAIIDLNRRFVSLILRCAEQDLPTLSVHLNVEMIFLREVRGLDHEKVEALVSTPRCLMQPAVATRSIERLVNVKSQAIRSLYVSSMIEHRNALF